MCIKVLNVKKVSYESSCFFIEKFVNIFTFYLLRFVDLIESNFLCAEKFNVETKSETWIETKIRQISFFSFSFFHLIWGKNLVWRKIVWYARKNFYFDNREGNKYWPANKRFSLTSCLKFLKSLSFVCFIKGEERKLNLELNHRRRLLTSISHLFTFASTTFLITKKQNQQNNCLKKLTRFLVCEESCATWRKLFIFYHCKFNEFKSEQNWIWEKENVKTRKLFYQSRGRARGGISWGGYAFW